MKNEGGALSLRAESDSLVFLSPKATIISTFNFQLLTFNKAAKPPIASNFKL